MFKEEFDWEKEGKNFLSSMTLLLTLTMFLTCRLVIFAGDVTPVDIMAHMPGNI